MKLSELFSDETKWIKGMMSGFRNSEGFVQATRKVEESNCFCLLGGVLKVAGGSTAGVELHHRVRDAAAELFPDRMGDNPAQPSISAFNDCFLTTFDDVQKVIRHVEASNP